MQGNWASPSNNLDFIEDLNCPVIAIRGRSGSGKTTLIARIVKDMAKKGFQIAVIKHSDKTKPNIDPKGKDTSKHLEAGASLVVGSFEQATVFFLGTAMALEKILRACSHFGSWDLYLIEGYYHEPIPNIALDSEDLNNLTIANSAEEPFEGIIKKLLNIIEKNKAK